MTTTGTSQISYETLFQVSAHALAETVLALDTPAADRAQSPLFGAGDAANETQAAAQTSTAGV